MQIFVGRLPYVITSDELREMFEDYGKVDESKVIIDRDERRSKGFGFVEMPDEEEGDAAIEGLNGTKVKGNTIEVRKATEKDKQ